MRRTIRKWFWVWNFDKEEKWLNEMAAKGLGLVSVGFCKFEFEDCIPGEYKICLQLLDKMPRHAESQKYIEFLESTGAEHIGSFTRWAYFRKKASEGEFQLFSDNASKVKYLSGMIAMVALLTFANWMAGLNNILLAGSGVALPINYVFGAISLLIGILGTIGTIRLLRKRKKLKEESRLFE